MINNLDKSLSIESTEEALNVALMFKTHAAKVLKAYSLTRFDEAGFDPELPLCTVVHKNDFKSLGSKLSSILNIICKKNEYCTKTSKFKTVDLEFVKSARYTGVNVVTWVGGMAVDTGDSIINIDCTLTGVTEDTRYITAIIDVVLEN